MLRYNTITDGQPQPGTASDIFCGKERIKNLSHVLRRNSHARILNFDEHSTARFDCAQRQRSAVGHRIDGISCQCDDGLLQLTFVAEDQR